MKKILLILGMLLLPTLAHAQCATTVTIGDAGSSCAPCDYSTLNNAEQSEFAACGDRTANGTLVFELYEMVDTAGDISIAGYTTDASNYLHFKGADSDMTASNRGTWSTERYRLEVDTNSTSGIIISSSADIHMIFEDMQIAVTGYWAGGTDQPILFNSGRGGTTWHRFINNIFDFGAGNQQVFGIRDNDVDGDFIAINNIIWTDAAPANSSQFLMSGDSIISNNTMYGNARCYWALNGSHVLKNNICVNGGTANECWYETGSGVGKLDDVNSINNTCNVAETDLPDASNTNSATPTFVDTATDNYLLDSADTVAKDTGTDLSADGGYAFDYDIKDNTRPDATTWDRGADEEGAAAGGGATCPGGILPAFVEEQNLGKYIALTYTCNDLGLSGCTSETTALRQIVYNQISPSGNAWFSWTLTEALQEWCFNLTGNDSCYGYTEYPAICAIADNLYSTTFGYQSETPCYYEVTDCDF